MTTTKLTTDRLARLLGVVLGVSVAVAALLAWRVPGGERTLGADVRFEALQNGEIGVSPLRPFASTPSLVPGSSISGDVTVRNQTGVPLDTVLRAMPSTRELDPLLRVRVSAGARVLYNGALAGLRSSGTAPLPLEAAQSARVHVRASLPAGTSTGFQGRIVDVSLQIGTRRTR